MSEEKRIRVKEEINSFVNENGKPSVAFYYDDCCLEFSYKDCLAGKTFENWEESFFFRSDYIEENWDKLLRELGLMVPVCPMNYFCDDMDEDEGEFE